MMLPIQSSTMALDIAKTRDCFPALSQPQVFFDNAGGSQALGTVIDSITNYLSKTNVQLGASYLCGRKSTAAFSAGYEAAAKFMNASVENVVLGPSTTQLFRNLSYSLCLCSPPGSEIIISKIDHESNIASWVALASRQNLTIKWWTPQPSDNPKLLPADLKELLTEKTVMVTCTHVSNILGTINDIKAIAETVHSVVPGALVCVDGVAFAAHRQIDVQDLGVDFYCFSWYKVYGPHMAILSASENGLKAVKSLGHFFNPAQTLADKLGLAGASYELVASIPAVLEYFGPDPSASWEAIAIHEEVLQRALLDYLNRRSDVRVLGETDADREKRVSTISFVVNGRKSNEVVEGVESRTNGEIGIKWGGFYSERLKEEVLGLEKDGAVRVSMVHYNTLDEVKRFVEILDQVLEA